jgi:cystathionine gamma-lyase
MASMNKTEIEALAARLLHHRDATLAPGDSVVPAIWPTAVFHLPGNPSNVPYVYGRYSNPTWEALEAALGVIEGAETLIFPSGMAAMQPFSHNGSAGDRVLCPQTGILRRGPWRSSS